MKAISSMSITWKRPLALIVFLSASVTPLMTTRARAAFNNGVDSFAGAVFDTSTWQVRYGSVVQNNALTTANNGTEVVTASALVSVGQGIRVPFEITQLPGIVNNFPGGVNILLTDDSAGASTGSFADSFAAELTLTLWPGDTHPGNISDLIELSGNGSGTVMKSLPDSTGELNRTLTVEIDRPSSQQYAFSFFDSAGSLVANGTLSAQSISGSLHVDLSASGGTTATFYSVTIVPEPASLAVLCLAAIPLAHRPRKGS